jgi:hypothetical protein
MLLLTRPEIKQEFPLHGLRRYPPEIAPTIQNGSRPSATVAGRGYPLEPFGGWHT